MHFSGKLTNQTSENGKNPNFEPNFGLFGPNLGPQFIFVDFTSSISGKIRILPLVLEIVPSYYPMQCKRKIMNQT